MVYDITYLFLVVIMVLLINLRYKNKIVEGFTNKDGRIFPLYIKKANDKRIGLMYRKEKLKKNHGMLFDYNRYGVFTFWMKNTFIPLEIICLDHNYKVLGIIKNMVPESQKSRSLDKPFRYAIEVNKGTAKKNNIVEGDFIEFIETNEL